MGSILVVEDESAIAELVAINLRHAGFAVTLAVDAQGAQAVVDRELPDLVLLDWMLPGQSGVQLARRWRGDARTRELPVIMLTARADEADKITGLDAGADDYLTKPFGVGELMARVRVALRRVAPSAPDVVAVGPIRVDLPRHEVTVDGAVVHLTPIEFKLLVELLRAPGRVLTHRHLLRAVWGPDAVEHSQYLRVHMAALRRKIERDPARPHWLLTEAGIGYRARDA